MVGRYRRGNEPRLLSGHAFRRLLRWFGNCAGGSVLHIGAEIARGRNDDRNELGGRHHAGCRKMTETAIVARRAMIGRRLLLAVH